MNNCLVYRNIRYAAAKRFAPAVQLPLNRSEILTGKDRGCVAPQHTSRFDALLGSPAALEQSEDCQVLSIFTPSNTGSRPVMIWFHGGANITGGGELPWYDGDKLSSEHDLVVVTVTARLGVFGYFYSNTLYKDNLPSPAMTDHLTAINWVHDHIAEFGGDPNNITLFGQSAGAFSIEVMLRWGVGKHIKRAIIQSGFLGQSDIIYSQQSALDHSEDFSRFVGNDPMRLSTRELLDAQLSFAKFIGRPEIWAPARPQTEHPVEIPVLAGWTSEDTLPFIYIKENITNPTESNFQAVQERMVGDNKCFLVDSTLKIVMESAASGNLSWAYELTWQAPLSGWRAAHCIELPFLLGSRQAWATAPMLNGLSVDAFESMGRQLRTLWANFVTERTPHPSWTPSANNKCKVNRIQ